MKKNNKLKAYRKLHDMTQAEMAKLLEVSKVSYCHKETGKQDFTLLEAKKIADFFKLSVDEIFFNNEVNIKMTRIV